MFSDFNDIPFTFFLFYGAVGLGFVRFLENMLVDSIFFNENKIVEERQKEKEKQIEEKKSNIK